MQTIFVIDGCGRLVRTIPKAEARREIAAGQAVKIGDSRLQTIQLTGHGESRPEPMSTVTSEHPQQDGHGQRPPFKMVLKTADGVEVAI